ncbi:MAG: hypothetical protein HUK26_08455, partial [Duodenibacillus sp.]|nr:hypothetical protein [Duodenibacillus sp.]
VTDEATGKRRSQRISVGHIKDGRFAFSELYLLKNEAEALRERVRALEAAAGQRLPGPGAEATGQPSRETDGRQGCAAFPLVSVATAAILSSLAGDASGVEGYLQANRRFFEESMPSSAIGSVTDEAVRTALALVRPERLMHSWLALAGGLVRPDARREEAELILCSEGCRVRFAGRPEDPPAASARLIEDFDLAGALVTAEAARCQAGFAAAVAGAGGDCLIELGKGREAARREILRLFGKAGAGAVVGACEVSLLPGRLLQGGAWSLLPRQAVCSAVLVRGDGAEGGRCFVSSLPPAVSGARRIREALPGPSAGGPDRVIDVHWGRGRREADRCALDKLALALLENYRFRLWSRGEAGSPDELSVEALRAGCRRPEAALECLAAGLGLP